MMLKYCASSQPYGQWRTCARTTKPPPNCCQVRLHVAPSSQMTSTGVAYAVDALPLLLKIAEECVVLSVRGTALLALQLLGSSPAARRRLAALAWATVGVMNIEGGDGREQEESVIYQWHTTSASSSSDDDDNDGAASGTRRSQVRAARYSST